MTKKTGLGKGLDALFATNNIAEDEKIREGEIIENLKLIDVEPNRNQPRKIFDEEKIEELAQSIKEYGVIQPIIVSKEDNYYRIVAGERRWRAAKQAGISEIPAIVRKYSEQENKEIALIENIQRENLNPIEKASALRELMDKYSLSQQQLANKLGLSRSGIANTVRLLNLDPRVKEFVQEGKLTEGHCKALLAVQEPEEQLRIAKYMIESGDSVREVEKQMKIKKQSNSKEKSRYTAVCRDIEDSFRNFFGTKVKVDAGKRAGKIIIQYSSNEELSRILDIIK